MLVRLTLVLASMFMLASCSSFMSQNVQQATQSSSLVNYLYPNPEDRAQHSAEIPVLALPVNVGLAFVPSDNWSGSGLHNQQKMALLDKVKASFSQHKYINRIEVIPDTYLKGGEGFSTLEQVARLYDVDVMALVSYDQVSKTYENKAAFLYLTIVGMYLIEGNENTVQTFVDTAVFDVKSRKMLFRAPGLSKLEESTTAINIAQTLSQKSQQGFESAFSDMITNLDAELGQFEKRVKEEKVAKVVSRNGSGSSISVSLLLIFGLLLVLRKPIKSGSR
ncbi:rhombotarget lipoprotein [Pseudoalteromonas sp. SSDWG2]|uniref:rhombotarget lipoprotein n=1 Tax=Pseudoalteromonas sp. SSDWG2 TaxID=3139391 RepID=UPI003BAC3FC6